jgi:hypothetical protein
MSTAIAPSRKSDALSARRRSQARPRATIDGPQTASSPSRSAGSAQSPVQGPPAASSWKTLPPEIALRRMARAEALGMSYRANTREILERGRYL